MTTTLSLGYRRVGPLTAIKAAVEASQKANPAYGPDDTDVFAVLAQGFWWWVRGLPEDVAVIGTSPRTAA